MSLRFAHAKNSDAPSRKVTVALRSERKVMLNNLPPLMTDNRSW